MSNHNSDQSFPFLRISRPVPQPNYLIVLSLYLQTIIIAIFFPFKDVKKNLTLMPFLPSRRANSLTHRSGTKSIRNSHRTVILFMTLPSPHQFKTLFIFSIQPPSSEPFTISQPFRTYLLLYLLFPFSPSLLVILRSRSYLLPMRNIISHTAKDITNNINRITEFCFSAQSSHHPSNLSHPCSYSYQALLQTQQSNTIGRTGPCLLSALCISRSCRRA